MPDALHVVISGYYGYANPGDEAILSVLLAQLRQRIPQISIAVISGRPEETAATHHVQAILWSDPSAIAAAVQSSDLVITGGGGIFHDYGGVSPQGLFTEGNWGITFHCTTGLLAALYAKPHAIYAVGVGPLFSPEARKLTHTLCRTSATISVRDEASLQLMKEIGVTNAELTADPAFLFEPGPAVTSPNRIGVVVRQWAHGVEQDRWEQELAAGLDQFLERQGGELVFFPFQQFPGEAEDDTAASLRVLHRMRLQDQARVWEGTPSIQEKAALLAGCRLVVAMRLHAVIFALRERVPVVALTYDEKVRQVANRAGLDGIDIPDLRAGLVCQRMEEAIVTPAPDVTHLRTLAAHNVDLALEALSLGPGNLPLPTLRQAFESLLAEQKKLSHWLREQKINFEYQIGVQQKEIEAGQQQLTLEQSRYADELRLRQDIEKRLAAAEQLLAETNSRLAHTEAAKTLTENQLAAMTADRDSWRAAAERLDQEKAAAEAHGRALQADLDSWKQLHQDTVRDWDAYSAELDRRLTEYRPQRAWRVMLGLRKAYIIATRQGAAGKFRLIPWAISALFGRGAVETEQLEFPQRPKPRKLP